MRLERIDLEGLPDSPAECSLDLWYPEWEDLQVRVAGAGRVADVEVGWVYALQVFDEDDAPAEIADALLAAGPGVLFGAADGPLERMARAGAFAAAYVDAEHRELVVHADGRVVDVLHGAFDDVPSFAVRTRAERDASWAPGEPANLPLGLRAEGRGWLSYLLDLPLPGRDALCEWVATSSVARSCWGGPAGPWDPDGDRVVALTGAGGRPAPLPAGPLALVLQGPDEGPDTVCELSVDAAGGLLMELSRTSCPGVPVRDDGEGRHEEAYVREGGAWLPAAAPAPWATGRTVMGGRR